MTRSFRIKGRKEYNDIHISDFHWRSFAICTGTKTENYFNQPKGRDLQHVLNICRECPVRSNCLYESFVYGYDGIWGGSVPEQRNAILRHTYKGDITEMTVDDMPRLIDIIESIGHSKSQALADLMNLEQD